MQNEIINWDLSQNFWVELDWVTSLASIIGILVFRKFLRNIPFRQILGWSTVIAASFGMTTLLLVTHTNRIIGISDRVFSLGDIY